MAESTRRIPLAQAEPKDIGSGFIWAAVATCGGVLAACALVVGWLYPDALLDRRFRAPSALFPAPRLQTDPAADMRELRARELSWLDGAGWVDQGHRVMHIPISEAMRQLAREGIPGWPQAAAPDTAPAGTESRTPP